MQLSLASVPRPAGIALLPGLFGLLLTLLTYPAQGFETLTEAQSLIYDRSHLANTTEGQAIGYSYEGADSRNPSISDSATLTITRALEEGRRDVEIDFLSDERHLNLPPFNGFRGNPIIMAMLEHIATTLSAETGGSALYFRNRIRDALASKSLSVESGITELKEGDVKTMTLSFSPFTNDRYLEKDSLFRDTRFQMRFSDGVPAGLLEIVVHAESGTRHFSRALILKSS